MLAMLARLADRRPWAVILVTVALAGGAAVFGAGVADRLEPYSADDPATESARADRRVETVTDAEPAAGVIALIEAGRGTIASPTLDRRAARAGAKARRLGDRAAAMAAEARDEATAARQLAGSDPMGAAAAQRSAATTQQEALAASTLAQDQQQRAQRLLRRAKDERSQTARDRVRRVEDRIESVPDVERVVTYYERPNPDFVSDDRRATYLLTYFRPRGEKARQEAAAEIDRRVGEMSGVTLGGSALGNQQVNEQVSADLERAELLALPLLFLLSLVFFRSLVAAAIPPILGGLSIILTFAALRATDEVTPISIFALNLVTGLGLGLAIDYSLFVVSRYREELARVGPGSEAILNTLCTAGRTVLFSGLTVAGALASLLVFPQNFLFSMGVGGTIVSLLAVVIALVVLPAALSVLGPRVNALAPRRLRRAAETEARPATEGFWYRWSRFVTRRAGRIAVLSTAALIALGIPFLGIKFIFADEEVLPPTISAHIVGTQLEERFDKEATEPAQLVMTTGTGERVDRYLRRAERVKGVDEVSAPEREGERTTIATVKLRHGALTDPAQETVRELRALDAPFPVLVGGYTAFFVDVKQSLLDHLPVAFAIVVAGTLLMIFLMTGSIVLPVKALVMNVLTLSATFGLLKLLFQDGRLEGLLDYTSQGALEITQPILLFALAFGLSTDYGVFLLARIKEARDAGAGDTDAVAMGLERTGRIVTAAAVLFAVAVGAFATSEIIFVKELGVGTALAVLIDASIIRALLVPSLMELLGRWNWWAPRPLRWLHERVGLSESGPPGGPAEVPTGSA